jgi:GWxTD domain-containing protein
MRQNMIMKAVVSMSRVWLSVAFVAMLTPAVCAHDGTGALRLWSDCASFRMSPGSANGYVEFYFEMKRADFDFRRLDDLIRADVYTWVRVTDSTGAPVDSIGGAFVSVVDDSTQLADSNFTLFFVRALELRPGLYRARTVLTDLNDKATSEAEYPFRVPDYSRTTLGLSDVQFGYDITHVTADTVVRPFDVLVKNQYKIYPDCRGLVSPARPRLYFYLEAYNLGYDSANGDGRYSVEFSIVPTDGSPARPLGPQALTKPGSSAVLASAISVRDLPAGLYHFRAEVTDPSTTQKATVEKPFQVVAMVSDSLTEDEIQQLRDIMSYIARPSEMQAFETLTPVGRRNFMVQFWKDRDPTPDTPANEFKDEHLRRMNFANQRFSVGFKTRTDGWRTDEGRVYIIYGPPDQIDRFPFTSGREAAEKWNYESLPGQGSAYFLFVDEKGFGEYRLVTSSARGEKRDPVWDNRIQSGEFERGR